MAAQCCQFSMFARVSDLLRIKACDVSEIILDSTPALEFTFRTSKTDPRRNGAISYLVDSGGAINPYAIMRQYFLMFGFVFGSDPNITDTSFLFARSQSIGHR